MRITYNQHQPLCSRFPSQTFATTHLRSTVKISLHYTIKKCTLREQISILLSYPNKLSPEHIKWKLASDFSSKHCKSTLSNFIHNLALALISHKGYTLHWKDHCRHQYILYMKKYKDISYEKMHLRDHKSILHLSTTNNTNLPIELKFTTKSSSKCKESSIKKITFYSNKNTTNFPHCTRWQGAESMLKYQYA